VAADRLTSFLGHKVVIDLDSPFVCLGKLSQIEEFYLVLDDADLHDLRDSPTTRENYIVAAKESGIKPNRRQVLIRVERIVGVSLFKHILVEEDGRE
jgi:hypothetical protein